MAGKKKKRGSKTPAKKKSPSKPAKATSKTAGKSSRNKRIAKSPKSKAKPARALAVPGGRPAAKRRPVGRAAPLPRRGKPAAAKRIAGKKVAAKRGQAPARAAISKPVPRKVPPRSIAARRAAPIGSPRNPAVARAKPAIAHSASATPPARPLAPTTTPTAQARPPAPRPTPPRLTPPRATARPAAAPTSPGPPKPPATPGALPGILPGAPSARPPLAKPAVAKPAPPAGPKTGVRIHGKMGPGYEQILSTQAVDFIVGLERKFRADYKRLLAMREDRQRRLDAGEKPDFLPETVNIRNGDWTVAPLPRDLHDRRVEIAGPPDRRTVVTALNSGAACYVADFEDATSPTWANLVEGQINLRDAVAGTIGYKDPGSGKEQRLNARTAVLIARPRGWHLPERHMIVDGEPISGTLFDFGLYFYHNARPLIRNGSGPYLYLPKLESHGEARLWNEIFLHAQRAFGLPRGTIKVTILIETILAAFEMDEILYELRDHAAGLTIERWDYLFSFIKKFRNDRGKVLPDRAKLAMSAPFLRSYSQLLVKTCHRREVHALGAMSAQVPSRDDGQDATDRVRQEKEREASEGYDGTWVAHPGLVPTAKAAFDKVMPHPNQVARKRLDVHVTAPDLLQVPPGPKTEAALRLNVAVGIGYVEAWLRGLGSVPLFNRIEDAAAAEISRAQVWQWMRHGARLDDGRQVNAALCRQLIQGEVARQRAALKPARPDRFDDAAELFQRLVEAPDCADFLTAAAYAMLAD